MGGGKGRSEEGTKSGELANPVTWHEELPCATFSGKKSTFAVREIKLLGYLCDGQGVEEAVRQLEERFQGEPRWAMGDALEEGAQDL